MNRFCHYLPSAHNNVGIISSFLRIAINFIALSTLIAFLSSCGKKKDYLVSGTLLKSDGAPAGGVNFRFYGGGNHISGITTDSGIFNFAVEFYSDCQKNPFCDASDPFGLISFDGPSTLCTYDLEDGLMAGIIKPIEGPVPKCKKSDSQP